VDDDPVLESKHKIFLSHSGAQKEFAEHLCKALEDRYYYPFFDKRFESLPKGKKFPSLIVEAARQCQLLVVVVSEEYFMSKWPMIELNAFVQATKVKKPNKNVAILPLFYGLSVSDLKDEKRQQRWLEKWKTFAKDDQIQGRITVDDWRFAVDELLNFNGLSYDQESKEIVAYENAIVSHISKLVLPDIKWHDSHVQGNADEVWYMAIYLSSLFVECLFFWIL